MTAMATIAESRPSLLPAGVGELLWETSNDLLGVLGPNGRLIRANPAWEAVLGFTLAELLTMELADVIHPEDLPVAQAQFARLMASGDPERDRDLRFRHKAGGWRWLAFSLTSTPGRDTVFLVGRDMTGRRLAEEELRVRATLQDLLLESLPLAFYRLEFTETGRPRTTLMTGQVEQLTGFAPERFMGESTLWEDRLHPEDRERMLEARRSAQDAGASAQEYRWRHADGSWRWLFGFVRFLPAGAGRRPGLVGAIIDVTDRKRREEELGDLAERLARSNQDLQQFAYVASHDLQEPLRMVSNFTQLLSQRYRGRLDREADEFIDFAVDGATRMRALIDDLLSYSKVQSGSEPFRPADSDQALDRARQALAQSIGEAGATVTHDPLPAVLADPVQLSQLFQNLLGNAVKYRGAEPPRIHVSAQDEGEFVRFSVRDNGIGIDPNHHERIFQVFQRLHGRGEYPGTGIGLAICKRIVERQPGGRIWVESAPGAGATFHFTMRRGEDRS